MCALNHGRYRSHFLGGKTHTQETPIRGGSMWLIIQGNMLSCQAHTSAMSRGLLSRGRGELSPLGNLPDFIEDSGARMPRSIVYMTALARPRWC